MDVEQISRRSIYIWSLMYERKGLLDASFTVPNSLRRKRFARSRGLALSCGFSCSGRPRSQSLNFRSGSGICTWNGLLVWVPYWVSFRNSGSRSGFCISFLLQTLYGGSTRTFMLPQRSLALNKGQLWSLLITSFKCYFVAGSAKNWRLSGNHDPAPLMPEPTRCYSGVCP